MIWFDASRNDVPTVLVTIVMFKIVKLGLKMAPTMPWMKVRLLGLKRSS